MSDRDIEESNKIYEQIETKFPKGMFEFVSKSLNWYTIKVGFKNKSKIGGVSIACIDGVFETLLFKDFDLSKSEFEIVNLAEYGYKDGVLYFNDINKLLEEISRLLEISK
jgi:hypothetical protein